MLNSSIEPLHKIKNIMILSAPFREGMPLHPNTKDVLLLLPSKDTVISIRSVNLKNRCNCNMLLRGALTPGTQL